jgi:hypothetical protein
MNYTPFQVVSSTEKEQLHHRVGFVHVPKTGGTSVAKSLALMDSHEPAAKRAQDRRWASKKTFAYVRNPWDHAVSWWLYSRICENFPFSVWVVDGMNTRDVHSRHPLDQWGYISIDGDVAVHRLYRFERMQEDWPEVLAWVGAPLDTPLEHKQHRFYTDRPHYSAYYSQEAIDYVAERAARIIDIMGYRFGEDGQLSLKQPMARETPAPEPPDGVEFYGMVPKL